MERLTPSAAPSPIPHDEMKACYAAAEKGMGVSGTNGRPLLPDRSFVLRVEHDDAGRANSVLYVDKEGKLRRQKARVVCLAAKSLQRGGRHYPAPFLGK